MNASSRNSTRRFALAIIALSWTTLSNADPVELTTSTLQDTGMFANNLAALDDVNSSGTPDVIVGASNETVNGQTTAGRAYVFDGGTGALLYTLQSPSPEATGLFGFGVAGVPDTNGDGVGDILVGSTNDGALLPNETDAGRGYLFDGATGALLMTWRSPNPNDVNFGFSIAGIEDITGDGMGDVAITGDQAFEGAVHVFNGATGALVYSLESPNPRAIGGFGREVKGIGDVTGDMIPDLLVGAYFEDVNGLTFAGRAYVFNGANGALVHSLTSPSPSTTGQFGFEVDGVPDLNGDGVNDLVVSAGSELAAAPNTFGRFHVFNGASGAFIRTLTSPNISEGTAFGPAVAGIADLNGDGSGDIVMGAWTEHGDGVLGSGRVYIVNGADGELLRTFTSPNAIFNGGFGWDVDATFDIDGDGLPDIVVAAVNEDQSGVNAFGRAYTLTTEEMNGGGGPTDPPPTGGCGAAPGASSARGGDALLVLAAAMALMARRRFGSALR